MLVNINYKGKLLESTKDFKFSNWKPRQYIHKCKDYTLVIFQNGTCRIMGCKKKLDERTLPFRIKVERIQSVTVSENLNQSIHLNKLAENLKSQCNFDPEIFPGLRMIAFNPLCVNVFASGKVVILGIKTLDYKDFVNQIMLNIISHI
jgi:TATA-box binding protein (TBP) (component of TFIID and TFIIIB)